MPLACAISVVHFSLGPDVASNEVTGFQEKDRRCLCGSGLRVLTDKRGDSSNFKGSIPCNYNMMEEYFSSFSAVLSQICLIDVLIYTMIFLECCADTEFWLVAVQDDLPKAGAPGAPGARPAGAVGARP